jgi:polysaccharide deacetylase 2 family uncharacterized protein YibQ
LPLTLTLGALVFACLLALQEPQLQRRLAGAEPTPAPAMLRADWSSDFPDRIDRVTDALARLPLALPHPVEEPQGSGKVRWRQRRYEVSMPAPEHPGDIDHLVAPLTAAARGVTVRVTEHATGAQVLVGIDGLLTHTLVLQWLGRQPRAAIIVDDLGGNLLLARELADVDAPLTFAVLPFAPFSGEVAELARMFGRQVLVHLPMADDAPAAAPAGLALQATATQSEILDVLNRSIGALPKAVGVSNHLGARFTADQERMRWLLEGLKDDALFFIDSQSSPNSTACAVAADISLPCMGRDAEVAGAEDERTIAAQVGALVEIARARGDAIAIVHPGAATAAGLTAAVPAFAAAHVDLVPVSMIVLNASLSKH